MKTLTLLTALLPLLVACNGYNPCDSTSPLWNGLTPIEQGACTECGKLECEASETGGDDEDLGLGELGLIWPQPTWVTPDYGFLDIDNPPAGYTYNEIELEEQRFAFSCAGAAPGVNNCAIGISGVETDFSRALGIGLCANWIDTWEMPEMDPGWAQLPGGFMVEPSCGGLQGPPGRSEIICKDITCFGAIFGDPEETGISRNNYWQDCTCNCKTDSDCPTPDGVELACEGGLCLPPFAAPPAPTGGPIAYGLSDWGGDLFCDGLACTVSAQLADVIVYSQALTWDDVAWTIDPTGGVITLEDVGANSIADRIGLLSGDNVHVEDLESLIFSLARKQSTRIQVARGADVVTYVIDVQL